MFEKRKEIVYNRTYEITYKGVLVEMSLLEQWRATAYSQEMDKTQLQKFWTTYFQIERGIYEQLLSNPDEEVRGTVKELAEKYQVEVFTMVGFLDGINESLKVENPIETMEEDTIVNLNFDKEKLYKNMVDAKADWLYELPQWDEIFTKEKQKELYREQKAFAERRRSEEMIHVHAEVVRSIKSAVENNSLGKEVRRCIQDLSS